MQTGFRRPWENDAIRRWVFLSWGGLWILLVVWMTSPSAFEESLGEEFAFRRVAESVVVQDFVRSSFPELVAEWGGFDEENMREEAGRVFDARVEGDDFPEAIAPHWATMFLLIEDPDRAREARKLIDESNSTLAKQAEIISVLSGEKEADVELISWAKQRYRQGTSELPEWVLLEQSGDIPRIEQWMEQRGKNVLVRGMAAHVFTILVIGFAVVGSLFFLARRKELKFSGAAYRLEEKGWRPRHLLREFFIAEILGIAGAVAVGFSVARYGLQDAVMIASGLVFTLVPLLWLSFRMTPGIKASAKLFRLQGPGWSRSQIAIFTAIGMGLFLLGVGALLLVDREGNSLTDSITGEGMDSLTKVLWGYFFAVVLAPISEEWVFRGFLFGGLRHQWGVIPSALISSAVFAVLHGYSLIGLLAVFLYGLVFCWIYQRSGSLLPGMIVHALFNFIATSEMVGWYSFH